MPFVQFCELNLYMWRVNVNQGCYGRYWVLQGEKALVLLTNVVDSLPSSNGASPIVLLLFVCEIGVSDFSTT